MLKNHQQKNVTSKGVPLDVVVSYKKIPKKERFGRKSHFLVDFLWNGHFFCALGIFPYYKVVDAYKVKNDLARRCLKRTSGFIPEVRRGPYWDTYEAPEFPDWFRKQQEQNKETTISGYRSNTTDV